MPLPMTPLVLTVLTSASTSASSRFPRANSTIGLEIPLRTDDHRCLAAVARRQRRHDVADLGTDHGDRADQVQRKRLVHEELRHPTPDPIRVVLRVAPDPLPHEWP